MSDCDVTQMEELMAREPQFVACTDCSWKGDETQLNNNNCPECNSYAIEFDISENIDDESKELLDIMREEAEKQLIEWNIVKENLHGLIEHKYFDFAESHDGYGSEGIVNMIEVKERKQGYTQYPHCREFGIKDSRLYMKHTVELETYDEKKSEYEGDEIEYWVWQTVGCCEDDYSGFLLLPMSDGRYWKISYSC